MKVCRALHVAVATNEDEIQRLGRRDVVIASQGTVTYLEWIHDLKDILHPAHFSDDHSIKLESGLFDLYTSKSIHVTIARFQLANRFFLKLNELKRGTTVKNSVSRLQDIVS